MTERNVVCLVGAQYGSEGKGHIATHLLRGGDFGYSVRVGGPNAGHTFYHDGRKWVSRSLPQGWIDPGCVLLIGPGAVVEPALLASEVDEVEAAGYDVRSRLFVDPRATVITTAQEHLEGGVHGDGHRRIGSTGEGVGQARMARLNRDAFHFGEAWSHMSIGELAEIQHYDQWRVRDTSKILLQEHPEERVLIEGTQGSGLSLTVGHWPYCTSADTNTAQLLADCGLPPGRHEKTVLVARTREIRVAGNSGPMFEETSWEALGLKPEVTTVTQKERRVGGWDVDGVIYRAVELNRPCVLFVTFGDYLWPGLADGTYTPDEMQQMLGWVGEQEEELRVQIIGVGVGPERVIWL